MIWYCMGVVWCSSKDRDIEMVCEMIEGVCVFGMEICVILGMLIDI